MYKIVVTDTYRKRAKKFFAKHPKVLETYGKILRILCANPAHPSLRLHKLSGKHQGVYSISITRSYRVVIQFAIQEDAIVLINIGSHDDVY